MTEMEVASPRCSELFATHWTHAAFSSWKAYQLVSSPSVPQQT